MLGCIMSQDMLQVWKFRIRSYFCIAKLKVSILYIYDVLVSQMAH